MIGYFSGCAALGVLIGFVVAMSSSPVIGTLLPLLFSLAGGAGAFFTAKADLNDLAERHRLNVFGIAISCFAAGLIVSAWLSVGARDASARLPLDVASTQSKASVDHALQLAQLRKQLSDLGASKQEIESALRRAPSLEAFPPDSIKTASDKAKALAANCSDLARKIAALSLPVDGIGEKIAQLKETLEFIGNTMPETAGRIEKEQRSFKVLEYQYQYLSHAIYSLAGPGAEPHANVWQTSDYEALRRYPGALMALLEAKAALETNRINFSHVVSVSTFFTPTTGEKKEADERRLRGWFAHQPVTIRGLGG